MTTSAELQIIELLRAEILARKAKNPNYSLRSFARQAGVQVPILSGLLKGKRRLTRTWATRILAAMRLDSEERYSLLKAVPLRKRGPKKSGEPPDSENLLRYAELTRHEYAVLTEWWHFAILALIDSGWESPDPKRLAEKFPLLTPSKVERSLDLLESLGMILRDGGGVRSSGKKFETTTDVSNALIQAFHRQGLELANDALALPVDERDFSSLTVTCDPSQLPELKKRIQNFRRNLSDLMERSQGRRVYRLQVQLFPVSED